MVGRMDQPHTQGYYLEWLFLYSYFRLYNKFKLISQIQNCAPDLFQCRCATVDSGILHCKNMIFFLQM